MIYFIGISYPEHLQQNTYVSKRHYRLSLKQLRMLYRSQRVGSMPQPHCQSNPLLNSTSQRAES